MSNLEAKILAKHHIINVIDLELEKPYTLIYQAYLWKRKEINQKKLKELTKRLKK